MGKKSTPSAPDPYATAAAQSQANKDAVYASADVNSYNQYTPYGSVTYTKNDQGVPTAQYVNLSAPQQQILDSQNQLGVDLSNQALNQAQYLPQGQYDLSFLGALPSASDFAAQGKQAQDAAYNQAMGLLNPQFDQANRAVEQQVSNRGVPLSGELAKNLRDQEANRQNAARQNAAYQAVSAGNAQQNQAYNQAMSSRSQAINEYNAQRQAPFNELSAYLQGTPVFQQQSGNLPSYQVSPSDVSGNINSAYQSQLSSSQNSQNALYGLLGNGASAAAMYLAMSDKSVKTNIVKIGRLRAGVSIYAFNYKSGGPRMVGVIAQEVEKVIPEAVVTVNGIKHVKYGML